MGNAVDKSKGKGYYGVTGEGISYEDAEGFIVVTVSHASPEETLPKEGAAGPRSPFELPTEEKTAEERTNLEGSIDSGYAEVQNKCSAGNSSPEHVPGRPIDIVQVKPDDADAEDLLTDPDCRTAKSLGNHHAYFGVRLYHYNDAECEGNRHILDNDL